MSFFHQPKPRRFHHEYIYYDERRENLKKLEQNASRELEKEGEGKERKDFQFSFAKDRKHGYGNRQSLNSVLFIMFVLLFLLLALFMFL